MSDLNTSRDTFEAKIEGGTKHPYPETIFRLELEGVRQSILHAFRDHSDHVSEVVSKAVAEFPVERYAREAVARWLPQILDDTVKRLLDGHVRARLQGLQRAIEKELYGQE